MNAIIHDEHRTRERDIPVPITDILILSIFHCIDRAGPQGHWVHKFYRRRYDTHGTLEYDYFATTESLDIDKMPDMPGVQPGPDRSKRQRTSNGTYAGRDDLE